jgi:hypothetical protein
MPTYSIPGQGANLILGRRMAPRIDTSAFSRLTQPAQLPLDMSATYQMPIRHPSEVVKGLGLSYEAERDLREEIGAWMKAPDPIAFLGKMVKALRSFAPQNPELRGEVYRRCRQLYQETADMRPDAFRLADRRAIVQKSLDASEGWEPLDGFGGYRRPAGHGYEFYFPEAPANIEAPSSVRSAFALKPAHAFRGLDLVWCCEEFGLEDRPGAQSEEGLEKGAGHKYIKRTLTGKIRPKYRYWYRDPKTKKLVSSEDIHAGAKFKVSHAGKEGHFEILHHDKETDHVHLKHDESGKKIKIKVKNFHKLVQAAHEERKKQQGDDKKKAVQPTKKEKKTEEKKTKKKKAAVRRLISVEKIKKEKKVKEKEKEPEAPKKKAPKLVLRREGEQKKLPKVGRAKQPPAPPKAKPEIVVEPPKAKPEPPKAPPAPELPVIQSLNVAQSIAKGGFSGIVAFGLSKSDLEQTAAQQPGSMDHAILAQPDGSFILVSKAKINKGAREHKGERTDLFMRGDKGQRIQKIDAEYVLMEAADIIASHNPDSFAERKDYPVDVQERRYHVVEGEGNKVDTLARQMHPQIMVNTNPDAINGAPVVTEDGYVLGGNGRTMGMQRAYLHYPESAANLKKYLANQAHVFGLTADHVEAMKQPILVRRVKANKASKDLRRLGRRMNEPLTQGLDPRSEEVALGKNYVNEHLLSSLASHMDPEITFNDFLTRTDSEPFVDALKQSGIIDEFNADKFLTANGKLLNEDGRSRVERVLAASILPDADVLDKMLPSLRANIAKSVGSILQAAGNGWDIRDSIMTAVKADLDMRDRGVGDIGRYLGQTELGFEGSGLATKASSDPVAAALLHVIRDKKAMGPKKFPIAMRGFSYRAKEETNPTARLAGFESMAISPAEAIQKEFEVKTAAFKAPPPKAPEPEQQSALFASRTAREPSDLVKAGEAPKPPAGNRLLNRALWYIQDQIKGFVAAAGAGPLRIPGSKILDRTMAFIHEAVSSDADLAREFGRRPISQDTVNGLIQAVVQAQGAKLVKSWMSSWALQKAEQLDLFGPRPAAAKKKESAPKPENRPTGGGWQIIPGGRHGGYRRAKGHGWEYWYPGGKGVTHQAKPGDEPKVTVVRRDASGQEKPVGSEEKEPSQVTVIKRNVRTGEEKEIGEKKESLPPKTYEHDPEPEPKFKQEEEVFVDGERRVVWSIGNYDSYLGQRRYLLMDPENRGKLWVNENSIARIPPKTGPKLVLKPPEGKRRFETAGKKIGGSRADLAAMTTEELEANPALAKKLVTKSNVIGTWDPTWAEADRKNGVSGACSFAKKEIINAVAGTPFNHGDIRDAYRKGCTRLVDGLARCKTTDDILSFLGEWEDAARGKTGVERDKLEYALFTGALGRRFARLVGHDVSVRRGSPRLGRYFSSNTTERRALEDKIKKIEAEKDQWAWANEKKEKITRDRQELEEIGPNDHKWVWTRDTIPVERKGGPKVNVPRDSNEFMKSLGLPSVEFGKWANDAEREFHIRGAVEGFSDLTDVLGIKLDQIGINKRLAVAFGSRGTGGKRAPIAHYERLRKVINITKLKGAGSLCHEWGHFLDHAISVAADSKSDKLMSSIVRKQNRAENVPMPVFDAVKGIMDAIMFSSLTPEQKADRGRRNKEALQKLGELTKRQEEISNKIKWETTKGTDEKGRLYIERKMVEDENYHALVAVVNEKKPIRAEYLATLGRQGETTHYAAAKLLSGGKYYCQPEELFARAFECYIEDKLHSQGRKSTYLVGGTRGKTPPGIYPPADSEERKAMNAAFDRFFETLKSHDQFNKSLSAAMRG